MAELDGICAECAVDVSVIVPCYNVAAYLDQALDSIAANDRVALEVLLIDDGSTDATPELLDRRAASDARFRTIHKSNGGYGAACNRGLSEARGSYVAIFEPDDYAAPHMYDELFAYACSFGSAVASGTNNTANYTGQSAAPDVVKSPYWRVIAPGTPAEHVRPCDYLHAFPTKRSYTLAQQPRHLQYHPSIWSALYRRDFLQARNIRFVEAPGGGWVDNPFMVETLAQAARIVFFDTPFYYYREELPTSSTATRTQALAFERWHDMHQVLDRLHQQDPGILMALYQTGFWHARQALASAHINTVLFNRGTLTPAQQQTLELVRTMYQRMKPNLVVQMAALNRTTVEQYFQISGYTPLKFRTWAHLRSRINAVCAGIGREGLAFLKR